MNTKSKYSLRFCAIIGFLVLMEILFCAFVIFGEKQHLLFLILIVPFFLVAKWILKFYKVFPSVTITNDEIVLDYLMGSKRISIDDVCEFQLTDSFPISKWVNPQETNGFSISTKEEEQYIFYEKYYKNPHELRAIFAQITNMNFEPRNSAIDNPLTSFSGPISFKFEIINIAIGLILFFVSLLFDLPYGTGVLFVISIVCICVGCSMIFDNIRDFLTIEVEGEEIRFKRLLSGKVITANLNDILTCNLSFLSIYNGYTGIAFSYITPDYRRNVIKGSNLKAEVWNELVEILEKNGVPVTGVTIDS
ncbi:MAG: hypothetical protein IK017_03660 [Paludibacteraceae bacterium]|nr:hypothetical protein [Paludibacteraceae bacterium]